MDSLGLLLSLYVTPAKVQDRIGALLARRAKGASASFEESLGRWRLYGREVGGVAKIAGWMGIADRPAECRHTKGFAVLPEVCWVRFFSQNLKIL